MIRLTPTSDIGDLIAGLRTRRGLSRTDVATRVAHQTGQTPNAVAVQLSRWESGRVRTPDFGALLPVLHVLGYDLALTPREDT